MRLVSFAILLTVSAFGFQNASAACTPKEIVSLSASGYSKAEIDALCAAKSDETGSGKFRELAAYEIPGGIALDGRVVKSVTWNDNLGTNYLFITETGVYPADPRIERNCDDESYCNSANLYGYHFVDDGSGPAQLWKIQDFIKGCSFDITLEYLQGSLSLTDIDGDGVAESSFLYRLACRSDVSGAAMKLMMHEGKPKYAIRGYTQTPYEPGEMRIDPAFDKAPPAFRDYAVERWGLFNKEFFEYFEGSTGGD